MRPVDTLTPMLGPSHYTLIWETQPPSLLLPHIATPACIHRDTCSSLLTLRGAQPVHLGHPGSRAKELPSRSCSQKSVWRFTAPVQVQTSPWHG